SYVPSSTLTHTSATTVAASSTTALPVSVRRNVRRGVSRFRAHAVRPVKLFARELTSRFFLLAHWRGAEEGAPGTAAGRAARHSGPGGLLGGRRGRGPDAAAAEYDGRRPSVGRSPECGRQRWDLPALQAAGADRAGSLRLQAREPPPGGAVVLGPPVLWTLDPDPVPGPLRDGGVPAREPREDQVRCPGLARRGPVRDRERQDRLLGSGGGAPQVGLRADGVRLVATARGGPGPPPWKAAARRRPE